MRKKLFAGIISSLLLLIWSCSNNTMKQQEAEEISGKDTLVVPAFDPNLSDQKAITLADEVIAAHGGEAAWNETRYISWNFLGRRDLVWDKYTGLVRIAFPQEESIYIVNVNADTGQVMVKNRLIQAPDSLAYYIDRAKQIWVNDAYWLVFPFKLKDPGVQLRYIGIDTTDNGRKAEIISLSFNSVGFTPENKYYAYIDTVSKLILQWDYFRNANDTIPSLSTDWTDYQKYGSIYLSSGRGERELSNISVSQTLDSVVFKF